VAVGPLRVQGRSGEHVSLLVRTPHGEQAIDGSDLLVAVGRTPNTSGIGLETAGVALDARGYVKVNDQLETTAPDVWAMGECAGSAQFTHVSFDDFRIIRDNLAGGHRTTRDRLIPFCLFTDPPLARVGLSAREAGRRGVAVRVATLPMSAVLRTQTIAETHGFMKALVDAQSDRILGFTMLGPEAGEVMAVVQTAMLADMPYPGLRDAILTHPTMAEGLGSLFANVQPKATQSRAHSQRACRRAGPVPACRQDPRVQVSRCNPAQKLRTLVDHAGDSTSVNASFGALVRRFARSRSRARCSSSAALRSRNGVRWVSRW
jgi:Pyridine nucleotide-disulphide oxidoreductase, dimerisation domain/Pyridine nucleotide-disulphide oxidoreductase